MNWRSHILPRTTGILTMIFAATLNLDPLPAADYYAPKVGQPHFDFVLPRIDNRDPVWLSQFRGQKVLLIQFASW